MAISAFLLSPSQERSRKEWYVQQPCLRHLWSIFLVCFMCGIHTSCLLGNILSSCCRRNMEYVLLSPLHFFHAISYCRDRCGLGWTWNVSYEQRLEALRKVRGRTANRWALEMEMLPSSSTVPHGARLGCPCLFPRPPTLPLMGRWWPTDHPRVSSTLRTLLPPLPVVPSTPNSVGLCCA